MTTTARAGRRRRILHEGAPAASGSGVVETDSPASGKRYTPPEGSASFSVATNVAPRSVLGLLAMILVLAGVTAAIAWGDQWGVTLAQQGVHASAARLLMIDQPGSLAAWWEAVLWLAVAVQAGLVFGLRRHRTDDTRGVYRWWLVVAAVAFGMSASAATTAPTVVAQSLAGLTGFSPLAKDAFWWLAPATLLLLTVGVRTLFAIRDSGFALTTGLLSGVMILCGWIATAGLLPAAVTEAASWLSSPLVGPVASMSGVALASFSLLLYSRRIVREALGEAPAPRVAEKTKEEPAQSESETAATPTSTKSKQNKPQRTVTAARIPEKKEPEIVETRAARRARERREQQEAALNTQQAPKSTQWTDGSEGGDSYEEDAQPPRRLSKAERKRLRREKARRAA